MSEETSVPLKEELEALKKENRALNRKLKEATYLVSSYEQYAVFQKSLYESIKKQKDDQDIYLRLVFSATPDIILVLDKSKKYILGTKKTIRGIGLDADSLTGKDFVAIFSPIMPNEWMAALSSDLQKVLDSGVPMKYSKYTVTIQDREHYYDINLLPIKDANGSVMGVMFAMHDETDLHEALESAEKSNRAKTSFLAKMSHEIRTPMNAITGMAELILREYTSGIVREHALSIKQASGNLMAIINDILDFSKIESGRLEITEAEYQFPSLINDVISIIRMRVIDKQVFFVVNIDCDIPSRLIGDEIRIRQILLNLLSNAVKYCDRGFISIHASCEKRGDGKAELVIDISDSGIGIRPDDFGKLFSDFVQLDRISNRDVQGTGLGLVITKSLCEAMGGDISVYSTYGKGSTFTVRIPQRFDVYEKFAEVKDPAAHNVLIYETRAAYSSSIICSIDDLGVGCALVTTQSKFLEELNKKIYTHVFVSSFLFDSTEKIISNLGIDITLVLLAEYGENAINTKNVKTIEMPVHSMSIADLLNGNTEKNGYKEIRRDSVRFIAPTARILIVDDLITNLRVAEGLMLPYRMRIDVCQSGAEAVELVRKNDYDIVFMDHMMPDMDGIQATNAIRGLDGEYYKTMPIVALTANAVSGVREMFLQNGFNDFLAKPMEIAKLNAVLETWLPAEKREPCVTNEETAAATFKIRGIDVSAGIKMTGGNETSFLSALSAFHRDGREKIEQLRECCLKGDLKLYAMYVHAIKSAAASIGAIKVSSFAKALESAARNEDIEYVNGHNDIFISELKALLSNIGHVTSANRKNGNGNEVSVENIKERVAGLRNALADLDIETADEILRGLQSENADEATNSALDMIANMILICEYDKAKIIADDILKDGKVV